MENQRPENEQTTSSTSTSSIPSLKELALQLSAVTVIADAAKETKDRLRSEFMARLEEVGADSAKAVFAGEDISKVSLVQPKASAVVLNEKAFTDWVSANWSNEIIAVVRESFRKLILGQVELIDGKAIYTKTGEVLDFITFEQRDPYVSTKFASAGREAIVNAFKSGELTPTNVLAKELSGIDLQSETGAE